MKKLVIFDLDGTLLYTVPDIAAATNHALAKYGYPTHSEEKISTFIGNGINKLFERALPEGHKDMEEVLRIRHAFIPYYDVHGADFTYPYKGIPELLAKLVKSGIKVAVASNKYQSGTAWLIPHFFPDIEFSAILGQRDNIPVKPDITIVEDILKLSGISDDDKASVLYAGDSGVDMQTAKNAGIESIAVTWGYKSREELSTYNPRWIVDEPHEISVIAGL